MTPTFWVQNWNGTWHAWPKGGRAALCNKVNAENLATRPARQIQTERPATGRMCVRCSREAGVAHPAVHESPTSAWGGVLHRRFTHARVRVSPLHIARLAMLLGEIGAPESAEAREVYQEIAPVFLTPRFIRGVGPRGQARVAATLTHLKEALALLPDGLALAHVAHAVRAWRTMTNRDPAGERFRLDSVVKAILAAPQPIEPYIRHLQDKGLCALAVMFHTATLDRARTDTALRGLFSGAADYFKATHSQLNIVTD